MFFNNKKEDVMDASAKYKVLGTGCKKCTKLYDNLSELENKGVIEGGVTKVSSPADIAGYGVMRTPALVVGEEVVFQGDSPSIDKLERILKK